VALRASWLTPKLTGLGSPTLARWPKYPADQIGRGGDRVDPRELLGQRSRAERVHASAVHEARVQVGDLL